MPIKIQGIDKAVRNLRNLKSKYPLKLKRGLVTWAEKVMTTSKRDFVPVDLGNLRATGHVVPHESKIAVDLAYGGPAAPYAAVVHEDLDARHPVGQAKYLEEPLLQAASTFEQDVRQFGGIDEGDL